MSKRPPINFYDLSDEQRKRIVKEAMEEAEKLQAKLVKKYERKKGGEK